MQAVFNGTVIADSDATVTVEGNHYFPDDSLRREFFTPSSTHTRCAWKGTASYYDVTVDGQTSHDAAWYYPTPTAMAQTVKDRVAFWKGVTVRKAPNDPATEATVPTYDAPDGATC